LKTVKNLGCPGETGGAQWDKPGVAQGEKPGLPPGMRVFGSKIAPKIEILGSKSFVGYPRLIFLLN